MKLVVFGLTISSSWGNGHATILRGLFRALIDRGHRVIFFERDVQYYAAHRDLNELASGGLHFYSEWADVLSLAQLELSDADVAMVTSYCPDGAAASELVCASNATRVFYDLDTPVTLAHVRKGEPLSYLPRAGLGGFDLVLSFTGGGALDALRFELGARNVAPLYGSVDPGVHQPVPPREKYQNDVSYLGTYAPDRQAVLQELFLAPARQCLSKRFLLAGAQYPQDFPWSENIFFLWHLAPNDHPTFYCSSRLTLNVTRSTMARMGWCPSGRLFEAAACGTPIVTDYWKGLEEFFAPGEEIVVARKTEDVIAALELSDRERRKMASAARERVLDQHTAKVRALEFEELLAGACAAEPIQC